MEINCFWMCSFLSSAPVYRILPLIKTYSSKESPFWFDIVLSTCNLVVTVSLGLQETLWSSSLVLYELYYLLGHLPALLSQLVGYRNVQDSKNILDLRNVLKSSKFLVVNLVKESFHLPARGLPIPMRHISQA